VTVTNEKVTNYIHDDDIVFSILSKLSIKSLKRFECVAKLWSLLFKNSHFMNMLRINLLSNDLSYCRKAYLLLQICAPNTYASELHSLSRERFKNRVRLYFPNPFQEEAHYHFDIFNSGSINDFTCVLSSLW
jgi:hypothetical protein